VNQHEVDRFARLGGQVADQVARRLILWQVKAAVASPTQERAPVSCRVPGALETTCSPALRRPRGGSSWSRGEA